MLSFPSFRVLRSVVLAFICCIAAGSWTTAATAAVDDDYNLALQFYKQERWELASERLQEFLKAAPKDHAKVPLAKLYLGQTLVHQQKFEEARPVFRDFVKQHPQQEDVPLAMYRVAECSYFLKDYVAARKETQAFLAKVEGDNPLAEWALQYLGETELQLGNLDAARKVFEKGLNQFPKGRLAAEMNFGLARSLDALGQKAEAEKLYEQMAASDGPRAADAQFNMAAKLFEEQNFQQAAERFATISTKFANHSIAPLATLNAGYSRYHLGQYDPAIKLFEKVRTHPDLGPTAEYWIGLSFKSEKKWDEAASVLLGQFEKDPDQPLAESLLFHAADSRLGAGNYDEALRLFRDVHRRWPHGDLADDSLHLTTEAALLAGDLAVARQTQDQFARDFPQSGLKLPQDLLAGRLLLAEGDQLRRAATGESKEAQQLFRDAAEIFTRVLKQSQIELTQSLARIQLARAWDRLGNFDQVIGTLEPLVKEANHQNAPDHALTALAMQSTALLALERYDEALIAAKDYLSRRPSGSEAADALANVSLAYASKQDWTAATDALAKLKQAGNPSLTERITFEVAEAAYDASQWEIARSAYQTIVDTGAEGQFYRPAISGLAYSLYEQGRVVDEQVQQAQRDGNSATAELAEAVRKFDEASRWFARLAELSAQQSDGVVQSDAMYMQGLSLRLARRLPAAIDVFLKTAEQFALPETAGTNDDAAVKAGHNAFRSAREAARAYQQQENIEQADAAFQLAYNQLKRQPSDRQEGLDVLINEWALLHYNADNFDRADELFAQLVAEQPKSPWADDARMLLAENQYFSEQYEPSRKSFRELVADDSIDDNVRQRSLVMLMDIAIRLEDWPDVTATAKTLAKTFPEAKSRWEAVYRQAEAAMHQEDLDTAKTMLTSLTSQRDNQQVATEEWFPAVWLKLAEAHLRLKEYDQVQTTADQFDQLFPDEPLRYRLDAVRGQAFQKQARFDEAREAFRSVVESPHGKGTETAASAQLFIAESFFLQKDYQKAFNEYYRVLLYGYPDLQAAALFQAGKSEELLKQWKGSAKSYRQLLEDYPDSEYAEQAQQRLDDLKQRFPDTVGE